MDIHINSVPVKGHPFLVPQKPGLAAVDRFVVRCPPDCDGGRLWNQRRNGRIGVHHLIKIGIVVVGGGSLIGRAKHLQLQTVLYLVRPALLEPHVHIHVGRRHYKRAVLIAECPGERTCNAQRGVDGDPVDVIAVKGIQVVGDRRSGHGIGGKHRALIVIVQRSAIDGKRTLPHSVHGGHTRGRMEDEVGGVFLRFTLHHPCHYGDTLGGHGEGGGRRDYAVRVDLIAGPDRVELQSGGVDQHIV